MPQKNRLPSYSTIRRVLLNLDYERYFSYLSQFFGISPKAGETIAVDGKVLRGSYQIEGDNPNSPPHPAIMLVSAYIVERGLILKPHEVEQKTNAHQSLTRINQNSGSCCGSSSPLMLLTPKKNL